MKERPDRTSAMVTAVAQGKRVEDLSARTPSTASFANPDGSWTIESHTGVVRSETDPEKWVAADPALETSTAGVEPTAVPFDVAYGNGGSKDLATVTTPDGGELSVDWASKLPAGTVDSNTVTFDNPTATADQVVVTSLHDGFNFSVNLDQAPAPAGEPEYRFPIDLSQGRFEARNDGSWVVFSGGEPVARISAPVMWDSAAEPQTVPVDAALEGNGTNRTLVLRPDPAWLTDPARVYPVTVDPTVSLTTTGDTWVHSALLDASSKHASPELQVGSKNIGVTQARSYLNFDIAGLGTANADAIIDAKVSLSNFEAGSCSGSNIRLSQVTAAWTVTGVTWGTKPATTATGSTTVDSAHGATACTPEDRVAFDATAIVKAWAGGAPNHGVELSAASPAQNASWRKYRSLENGDNTLAPTLTVTVNHAPAKPTGLVYSPGGYGNWVQSTTPKLSAVVTDPDGGQVSGFFEVKQGSSIVWSGTSDPVPSGGTATIEVPSGELVDGGAYTVEVRGEDELDSRSTVAARPMTVDATAPTVAVSSPDFTNGTWRASMPSSATMKLTGSSDTAAFYWNYQGVAYPVAANASGVAEFPFTVMPGWFEVTVTPVDRAGNKGTPTEFSWGTGSGAFTTPTFWTPSTDSYPIDISGPAAATGAELQWRRIGETSWRDVTKIKKADGSAWSGSVTGTGRSHTGELVWNATEEPYGSGTLTGPALIELKGCFTYASSADSCTASIFVTLFGSAFEERFPVTDLGPAQVALASGEAMISGSDAADSSAGIGRTFASHSDATLDEVGVFGPGWSDPQILTAISSDSAAILIDNRDVDGTIVIVDADNSSQVFKAATPAGTYTPAEPTGDATSLKFIAGTPDRLELSRPLGSSSVTTTWEWKTSDTGTEAGWVIKATDAPGTSNDLAVASTGQRPTFIRESDPTAAATCNTTTQTVGCRALRLTYTGTGPATRVSKIERVIGGTTPSVKQLAAYTYTSGKLTKVCGPPPTSGSTPLCTEYTYTTVASRTMLATLKPAGLKPWRFTYDGIGRLLNVKREKPEGGDATWSIDYHLNVTTAGLPDMSTSAVEQWGQVEAPTKAFAVYRPHTGGTDVAKAEIIYADKYSRVTNTANHGPGGWLVDTSWYDNQGNTVQHLDGQGWTRVQAAPAAERPSVALDASSFTVYNTWGDPDTIGQRITDEYGPAHTATLENGTTGFFRTHTAFVYDDTPTVDPTLIAGRPDTDGLGLVVKEVASTATANRSTDHDAKVTKYGYTPTTPGDGDGWELGQPTSTSARIDSSTWATTVTRYDAEGNQIEIRKPGSDGADALATFTTYYTATGTGDCGGKPAWEGMACKTGPVSQPTGGGIPTIHYSAFNADLAPTTVTETVNGAVKRTTTTTADDLGRVTQMSITTGGSGVATDTVTTSYGYNASTGLPASYSAGAETVTVNHDDWGRQSTYTDAGGNTAATTYDSAGRVSTSDTGALISTYSYDSFGYLKAASVNGDIGIYDYTYLADGSIDAIDYPNGIRAKYRVDELGTATGVGYSTVNGEELVTFSAVNFADRRVKSQASSESAQTFTYDGLGRLTTTQDNRDSGCVTRAYGFNDASDRTTFRSYNPTNEGECQTSNPAVNKINSYDGAGRITNSGYTYDLLGRTLTTPVADTTQDAAGPLSASYRANDMVQSLTQEVTTPSGPETRTRSYVLDPVGRIRGITSTVGGAESERLRYNYSNSSDSPTDIQVSNDSGTTWTTTKYASLPGLGMAAEVTNGTPKYHLANVHGDQIATTNSGGTIGSYSETDEYGNPVSGGGGDDRRYGWLGTHQRSTDSLGGLTLMGVRLYNPRTGLFLSTDRIPGGNSTTYTYPQDPVNMSDTTGLKACFFGWGNCSMDFERHTGSIIHASKDTLNKIKKRNISLFTLKLAIYHAEFYAYWWNPVTGVRQFTRYDTIIRELECSRRGCRLTGDWVQIIVRVDWRDGKPHHGRLNTAYCRGKKKGYCPDWVNKNQISAG